MKKVYLGHPISTKGEFNDSIRVAERIRELGYKVYAAAENDEINDKTNDPTPRDIFIQDTDKILESDIFLVNVTGGQQDGTITEIGFVGGWNEHVMYTEKILRDVANEENASPDYYWAIDEIEDRMVKPIKIIAYTSNARILDPQFYQGEMQNRKGIPSGGANHYTLGLIDFYGTFVGTEDDMIEYLEKLKEE